MVDFVRALRDLPWLSASHANALSALLFLISKLSSNFNPLFTSRSRGCVTLFRERSH